MTEYTLRVPVAMCGDVIALCLVAEAMARHAATGYGTLPLHRPSFNNLLPKRVALLVDAACHGQLKVCDCNGLIKPAKEIIEAKDKLNIDSPDPELNVLSLYVKKQHLIEWGNANGDVFHIVDAPAEVVEFGPKNAHGEFAVRGFVGGLDASAAKGKAATDITPYDITAERGCRRLILENWDNIKMLYGDNADGRQVHRVLLRNIEDSETKPKLKTVQNRLIELRKEKLIP